MDQRKLPSTALRVLYGALIGAACVIGALFPPALLVVPGILAFLAVGWGAASSAAAVVALSLAGYFLSDATGALYILALNLPAALTLAIAFARRKSYRGAMVVSATLVFVALYAIICLPGVLEGRGPAAGLLDMLALLRQNMITDAVAQSSAGQMFNEIFDMMEKTLPDLLIAGLALAGMSTAGVSLILCRVLARRAGARLRPMARLERWRLGRGFTAGALILLLGALAIVLLKFSYAASVMYVIQMVVMLPLALQGVALLDYFAQRSRNRALTRTLYVFAIVLFLPFSVLLAAGVGALEQVFQIRRRFDDASRGVS
ncbi:MAG: DUF2232 domain-containing protein [Bacillota bacterium]